MEISVKLTVMPAGWQSKKEIENVGQLYVVTGNSVVIGTYYSKDRELILEAIPAWLMRDGKLEKEIQRCIEEKLGVKVKTVSMFGRDFT